MIIDKIDCVRDSTMQGISRSLAAMAVNSGGYKVASYADAQAICRAGLAGQIFHTGDQIVVERETGMNATVGNSEGITAGITAATVIVETFIAAVGEVHSGDYEFTYNGAEWHYNGEPVQLAAFGITVTGTPVHGDEVIVHETAAKLYFDVIGRDHDEPADPQFAHSISLQLHDCIASMQYDAPEALFAFPDGLNAGTYYFTIDSSYDATYNDQSSYCFTLANPIPAGGIIMFGWGYQALASKAKITSYASLTATTAIETVSTTEATTGISLGNITTAGDFENNINSIQRARYGSNNWKESAMRQYLNSDKPAGQVWTPQTKFDRPPSWATTTAGFLYGIDPEFVKALGKVKKITAKNNVTDGGGVETNDELVFLLSRTEVYGGNETSTAEGKPYAYYSDYSDYSAANAGADKNRIKYRAGTAQYWWLRSPNVGNANSVRNVYPSGSIDHYTANNSNGVAPACCII